MRRINIAVELECGCESPLHSFQPAEQLVMATAQIKFECPKCGTKYFVHIQEVKKI